MQPCPRILPRAIRSQPSRRRLEAAPVVAVPAGAPTWNTDAEKELSRIPFFVRGKARRNTERFAEEHGVATITIETLYDAKAHFSR